jgi:hypothetical protein
VTPRPEPQGKESFLAQTTEALVAPPPRADERLGGKSPLARLLAQPGAGAIAGAIK